MASPRTVMPVDLWVSTIRPHQAVGDKVRRVAEADIGDDQRRDDPVQRDRHVRVAGDPTLRDGPGRRAALHGTCQIAKSPSPASDGGIDRPGAFAKKTPMQLTATLRRTLPVKPGFCSSRSRKVRSNCRCRDTAAQAFAALQPDASRSELAFR